MPTGVTKGDPIADKVAPPKDSEDPALEKLRRDTKIANRPRVKEMPQALAESNTGKTKRDHHPVKSSRVTKSMAEVKKIKEKQQDKETRLGPEKTRIAKEAARKRRLDEDEAMANAYQRKFRYLI